MIQDVFVVIPSLNPDDKLIQLVASLRDIFQNIIIVNDGSSPIYDHYYEKAAQLGAVVLRHYINMGKGRALKDAFNYILSSYTGGGYIGAVCVDSDGQHSLSDIVECANAINIHPNSLILGCRSFKELGIPFRSRFGNILTSKILNLLCGIKIHDTQTGLRAFSKELMEVFLGIPGERYEYEMNMLLETKERSVPIIEIPIQTIYINDNSSSHFNPILDSFRIYKIFLKFIVASLSSFVIDIVLFNSLISLLRIRLPGSYILLSTVAARIGSSIYNYTINKKQVFKSPEGHHETLFRYYILCTVQMFISSYCVNKLYSFGFGKETFIKVAVDTVLFVISFKVQREWVFARKD